MGILSCFKTLISLCDGEAATPAAVKSWSNLPENITSLIMDHLYYPDQIRFRAVCKSWRSDNVFAIKSADTLPWVFAYRKYNNDPKKEDVYCIYSSSFFLYDPSGKRRYTIELPKVLVNARILYSKYGWILLSKSSIDFRRLAFFLYCPFTGKIIELPTLEKGNPFDERLLMSASPNSSTTECIIFSVRSRIRKNILCISICRPGDKTWTSHEFLCSFGKIHGVACWKGLLCCMFSEQLFVFNPETKTMKTYPHSINLPAVTVEEVTANRLIESESDEKLLMIYFDRDCHCIRVFYLDSSQMNWFELENLADKLLFVGYTDSISVPARGKASELANTVNLKSGESFFSYFPRGPRLLHSSNAQMNYSWIQQPWWGWNNIQELNTVWIQPPSSR
ncbi:F-box family protein [Melia azedarach]|uniref:F-box family protein n=1 Tax=Melia azedarach TaxID=155640 RepID=A0ACC1Y8G1_MELAZ|nr:F-box family protein [Melia azedarach]